MQPIASFPIASFAATADLETAGVVRALAEEGLVFADTPVLTPTYAAVERMRFTDSATLTGTLNALASESIPLREAAYEIANLLANEGLTFDSSGTATLRALLFVSEVMRLTSGASSQLEIAALVAEQLALRDFSGFVYDMTAEETLALADQITARLQAMMTATETLELSESLSCAIGVIASERIEFTDSPIANLIATLHAQEGLLFISRIPTDEGDFECWVMNSETTGMTRYEQFPFNSLLTHDGRSFGVSESGLFELVGADDAGADIHAAVRTGDLGFGTSREKNVPRAYLYLLQSGALVLKTVSTQRGQRTERVYELAPRDTDGEDDETLRRVKLARGLQGTWWSFEVQNVDGADFDFKGAEVIASARSRRG